MKRLSISEARKNLPDLVKSVESGEVVEFTRRGHPVAILMSVDDYQQRDPGSKQSAWDAILEFRTNHGLEDMGDPDEIWKDVRDRSPGRDVHL